MQPATWTCRLQIRSLRSAAQAQTKNFLPNSAIENTVFLSFSRSPTSHNYGKSGFLRFLEFSNTALLNNCSACRLIPAHRRLRIREDDLRLLFFQHLGTLYPAQCATLGRDSALHGGAADPSELQTYCAVQRDASMRCSKMNSPCSSSTGMSRTLTTNFEVFQPASTFAQLSSRLDVGGALPRGPSARKRP